MHNGLFNTHMHTGILQRHEVGIADTEPLLQQSVMQDPSDLAVW